MTQDAGCFLGGVSANLLSPSSRLVGEKTDETASEGWVQPGGGSFWALAQAVTEGMH
jgi:hypothetical protein